MRSARHVVHLTRRVLSSGKQHTVSGGNALLPGRDNHVTEGGGHVIRRVYSSGGIKNFFGKGEDVKERRNVPLSGNDLTRSGGIASMMRLPVHNDAEGLDACFVGVPLDCGTSNRPGTRLGPRQIRTESCLIRASNYTLGAMPFGDLHVGDIGDVDMNIYNLPQAIDDIKNAYDKILKCCCIPLTLGGDHTITYPILQAMRDKYGPVGLIHLDAHSDTSDTMLGAKIAHGTPFRRAVEDGCLDCKRVVQIGLRGSIYTLDDYQWASEQGFRLIMARDCWHKSMIKRMEEIRCQMGTGPVYISFDIDALDPSLAPGTGTPEIGGLTIYQALEIIHGCHGLNIVGGDMVEVSPPYDMAGTTALTAANLLFEMLCVLPKVKHRAPRPCRN